MDVLLGLVLKVSREYGFSAFVLALLMLVFYWIVTNKQLIKVADKVLNQSLSASSLYRFIKLAIILVFIFSIVVAILAFATPVILRHTENRSLELVMQGRTAFEAKNYPEARDQLTKSLALMNPDDPSAEEVRGLVTATYYVNDLHLEGLNFICEQYRYKPASDRSYLYSVHAHLRKIAVTSSTTHAEETADLYRRKCARADFSKYWAHIPFGMMESLRVSRLRTEHGWSLSDKSRARLLLLLDQERQSLVTKKVPLGDFVLYFLGNFDELARDYPDSMILDVALFDAAMFVEGRRRAEYLEQFVDRYPKSPRVVDGLRNLAKTLADLGDRKKALSFVARIVDRDATNRATAVALRPTLQALDRFVRDGDLGAAHSLAVSTCNEFSQNKLPCFGPVEAEIKKTEQALKISQPGSESLSCPVLQARIRTLAAIDDRTLDHKWLGASRALLVNCLKGAQVEPDDYARSLYLVAAISRQLGDYKTSLEFLERFAREIASHELLDDVLTEIGFHKLMVERDWPAARIVLEKVIEEFPTRNAYDNALWWYARGLRQNGDFLGATRAYSKIVANEASSRFKQWSNAERQAIQSVTRLPPFEGISLEPRIPADSGVLVASVADTAPTAKLLSTGDRLVRVCEHVIFGVDDILTAVASMEPGRLCRVLFLRRRRLISLTGPEDGKWKAGFTDLTQEQLRQLTYGTGKF